MNTSWRKQQSLFMLFISIALAGCGRNASPLVTDVSLTLPPHVTPLLQDRLFSDLPSSEYFKDRSSLRKSDSVRERLVQFNAAKFEEFLRSNQNQDPTTTETRPLSEVMFHLFNDIELEIEINSIDHASSESISVFGRVAGDPDSEVHLILQDGSLVGDIYAPIMNERLEIRPLGQGAHVIRQLKPESDAVTSPPPEDEEHSEQLPISGASIQTSFPVIDILVAYSPKARAEQGGTPEIEALIQRGIADANRAFEDSGVKARVRLVGTIETRQNETSDLTKDLYALMGRKDGRWDEVHAERDRVRADQVSFVGVYRSSSTPSGVGFFNARPDSAFTVVKTSAFDRFTLVHELGHNLGLNHSDGWKSPSGRFSTIMAYGANRICRFSNPILFYNGHVTGSPSHNEVDIINTNAPRLAAFR